MSLLSRLRGRAMHSRTKADRAYWTRALLRAKAKAGVWDDRMLNGHPGNVTVAVKRFIRRGVANGLICTSTTDGAHAPTSFHYGGGAADLGHRQPGTRTADRALRRFQRKEVRDHLRFHELYGPANDACVRGGRRLTLVEGTALEQLHDNHVHGAPRR